MCLSHIGIYTGWKPVWLDFTLLLSSALTCGNPRRELCGLPQEICPFCGLLKPSVKIQTRHVLSNYPFLFRGCLMFTHFVGMMSKCCEICEPFRCKLMQRMKEKKFYRLFPININWNEFVTLFSLLEKLSVTQDQNMYCM
jgi:hypothetical protein